jgi:hypothetical protein
MENTLVSFSRVGACAMWRRYAIAWKHKVEEAKIVLKRENGALNVVKCRRKSLLEALKTIKSAYVIVPKDGVLCPPEIKLSDIECVIYAYFMASDAWYMRDIGGGDWISITGRPPRPNGRWAGLGGIAVPKMLCDDIGGW